ncbi:MAG: hypothetical protein C0P68_000075 [Bacillota bacterium]
MFGRRPCPPRSVTERPIKIYRNVYHPQPITVVQPVEIIYRHICCPFRRRVFRYQFQNQYESDGN